MTDTRCDLTDLLADQCGCPQHRGGHTLAEQITAERAALLARAGWFPAQYPGSCGRCGTPFEPGAAIAKPAFGELGWTAECCAEGRP